MKGFNQSLGETKAEQETNPNFIIRYGTRKIKVELEWEGIVASRKRISKIMKKYDLVSKYTKKRIKKVNNLSKIQYSKHN